MAALFTPEQLAAIGDVVKDTLQVAVGPALNNALSKSTEINRLKNKVKRPTEFKRKGNEKRFKANEDVLEKLEDVMDLVQAKSYEDAENALQEGKKLVETQQKHIKIADREPDGWDVVNNYLSDDLADDSSDEKAIKKARKQASLDKKERVEKRKTESKRTWQNRKPRSSPQDF